MKFAPHEYERAGIQRAVQQATLALLWDPGLGKTVSMLSAFSILQKKGINRKMLVIAPLRVCHSVWPREARKWDHLNHLRVQVLHGPDKEINLRADADVYVVNPEGLPWLSRAVVKAYTEWPWDVLCVDESTKFKHTRTERFRLLRPMIGMFKRRYILTGSPAPNGLLDLYGQIYILDCGSALGRTLQHYRVNYFDQGMFKWTPKPGVEPIIYEKLKPLAMRLAAKDYLELPPLVENEIRVTLPDDVMQQYKDMERELLALIEDNAVTAANAAVASGKCRQIAGGGVFVNSTTWKHLHEEKTDAVEDLIEELQGTPALVAYEYQHDLDRLRRRLGDVPVIGGGISTARFREIESGWNRGEIPVLLAQPQSVAHGVNLQGTHAAVIFHSPIWNLEVREQFIRRVWRQGQTQRVVVHTIIAEDTIDEVIVQTIAAKDKTQQALLDALKSHLKRRKAT